MTSISKALLRRLLLGMPLDVLGSVITYCLTVRWDLTIIVGGCLVAGHLNSLFILYLVRRRQLESERDKDY